MGIETVQNLKKEGNIGRRPNADRQNEKNCWWNVYDSWNDIDFKDRFRLIRKSFELIIIKPS